MTELTYKVGVIASIFGVTERRVQQLVKDGIIPKPTRGNYELIGCVQGYIAFMQERAFGKNVGALDAHQERARLLKAQADKTEIEVQTMNGLLIPAAEAESGWAALVVAFRSRLSGLPTRGAHLVIGKTDFHEVKNALRELVQEALTELSLYDPFENSDSDKEGGADGGTASGINSEPVGGQLPAAE